MQTSNATRLSEINRHRSSFEATSTETVRQPYARVIEYTTLRESVNKIRMMPAASPELHGKQLVMQSTKIGQDACLEIAVDGVPAWGQLLMILTLFEAISIFGR